MGDGKRDRFSALRRVLGILVTPSRWAEEERARRLARLEAALARALPVEEHERIARARPGAPRGDRATDRTEPER